MTITVSKYPEVKSNCYDFRHPDFVVAASLNMMQYAADAWIATMADEDVENMTAKQLMDGTDEKIKSIAVDLVEDAVAEFRAELIKNLKEKISVHVLNVTVGPTEFDSTIVISHVSVA